MCDSHQPLNGADSEPLMVEVCGCGENAALPFDQDGDGIGEVCRRCGDFISYQAKVAV